LQKIQDAELESRGIGLWVLRDDLNDPLISGNKMRKLRYNLLEARAHRHRTLLSFGGAYSNHIHALAAAGHRFGLRTIGIIRGERPASLNPTLADAQGFGMELHFVSRSTYRNIKDPGEQEKLQQEFGPHYRVPEGGSNTLAVRGVAEMTRSIDPDTSHICLAVGTGGTMAGVIAGMEGTGHIIGMPVLKDGAYLAADIAYLLQRAGYLPRENWHLETGYHFGGYARHNQELVDFINGFYDRHGIPLDPVYTGKMMYGIYDMVQRGLIPEGSKLIAIHTGGLQGIRGFNDRFGHLIRYDPRCNEG
jgi:1-aminocyclopropane-1-carboxylate deaminase/D-cysteine desulfhydrase-like pyridoxal-dependent ACC family enzyme